MNYYIVLYILGCVLKFESAFLLLPFIVGLLYHESAAYSYLVTAALCFLIGMLLSSKNLPQKIFLFGKVL